MKNYTNLSAWKKDGPIIGDIVGPGRIVIIGDIVGPGGNVIIGDIVGPQS